MDSLNILLVEDNEIDIILTKELLKYHFSDIEITVALNGQRALDQLTTSPQQLPDLILLDINMPIMDGFEFLENIQFNQILGSIPVIVLTSSNNEADFKRANDLGAVAYAGKPLDIDLLKDWIKILRKTAKNFN